MRFSCEDTARLKIQISPTREARDLQIYIIRASEGSRGHNTPLANVPG